MWTDLEGASLEESHLEDAYMVRANLKGACLIRAHLEGTKLNVADLQGVNMVGAVLDDRTSLLSVNLSTEGGIGPCLADANWGGANLSIADWSQIRLLGDEHRGRQHKQSSYALNERDEWRRRLTEQAAIRANRQLATALRAQGLSEDGDRFAYRAQLLQRAVLRRQAFLRQKGQPVRLWRRVRRLASYAGSLVLDLIAGYGYRPLRSIATYLLVVGAFAGVYFVLGGAHSQSLSWNEAVVVSLTAFHGRGFFATAFQPGDPQAAVAAIEAVFGLLIEITFIATFTQRFFAR